MANWISKPVSALSQQEQELWRAMRLPDLPLSQELSWGRAVLAIESGAWIVFSPERRVSALFMISGTDAECVNGPVLDWSGIESARELNERIGTVVYALHQAHPALQNIRLRPRLLKEQFEFLRTHSAFPLDQVDRACTAVIRLKSTPEEQWRALPGRVRHEVSRALKAGAQVADRGVREDLRGFWDKVLFFYRARGLYVPELRFMEALFEKGDLGGRIITIRHPASASEAGILVVVSGESAFYLYAYEERFGTCPNISLNVLAQWEAQRFLVGQGIFRYDLNGVLHPSDEGGEGFHGVDAYKRKFKGDQIEYTVPCVGFGMSP